jgi:8-oxo-dGTP pyrophosphatase MutT (NUDIX family)
MKEISGGGVVYRKSSEGGLEIQLIEDRFGQVTLPKGRMEPGESIEQTALREIREETGITGHIIEPLAEIRYQYDSIDRGTVDKVVHYFLVEADGGQQQAQVEEIAGVSWYAPREAWRLQRTRGYDNNCAVLARALALLGISTDALESAE